jgi:hypothetical protein
MQNKIFQTLLLTCSILTTCVPLAALAETTSFSDVPVEYPHYRAIEFLHSEGIINGYPDGTFKPAQVVNRAEALKIMLEARKAAVSEPTESSFSDVPVGEWYAKYVEAGKTLGIIGGNPDGTFAPARTVNKVEFLKMLLLAYEVKFVNYQAPEKPLYPDTPDNNAWYIQYLDFAKSLNLVIPNAQGLIEPDKGLSRGEVADITYKLIVIIRGGPVQLSLSRAEAQLMQAVFDLQFGNLEEADLSIKNAKDLANQALEQAPDESIVQAAVKVIEAFEALIAAFRQNADGQDGEALASAGKAYNTAEEARQINSGIDNLAVQVKNAAKSLADSIRAEEQ